MNQLKKRLTVFLAFTGSVSLLLLIFAGCSWSSENYKPNMQTQSNITNESADTATFGAGCFWCVEAVFSELKGVISVKPGYSGGSVKNPSYKEVCTGTTGHAEVAQIVFDPKQISFEELLEVFFQTHDPTTLNRQGADVGSQYRSVIFYHHPQQKETAERIKKELNESGAWTNPVVTEITAFTAFYPAGEDHQEYYKRNPEAGYCRYVIQPKMDKFRKVFHDKLK